MNPAKDKCCEDCISHGYFGVSKAYCKNIKCKCHSPLKTDKKAFTKGQGGEGTRDTSPSSFNLELEKPIRKIIDNSIDNYYNVGECVQDILKLMERDYISKGECKLIVDDTIRKCQEKWIEKQKVIDAIDKRLPHIHTSYKHGCPNCELKKELKL